MSKIIIALCLLAIVFFVAAQEAAAVAPKKIDLKSKLVQKIKDKVKAKIQQRGRPQWARSAVKLPLKEKIAGLKEKLTKLRAKRDAQKQLKSSKPRSGKPASRKPRSRKPSSRKPKAETQADAAFFKKIGKLVKKVAPLVKKGFEIYGKVKGMGILSEQAVAPKSRKPRQPRSGKPASRKPRQPKSGKPASRKPRSGKPASRKPKSGKPASRKPRQPKSGKPASRKPRSGKPASRKPRQPKSGKPASRRPRSQKPKSRKPKTETQADAAFFKKIGKLVKKVAPLVKKGFEIYGKVKGMGILSESEFLEKIAAIKEKVNKFKKFVPKDLKEKLKAKLGDKLRSSKFNKLTKIGKVAGDRKELIKKIADKLKKRIADKKQAKTEADFGFLAGAALKKLAAKKLTGLAKNKLGGLAKKGISKLASKKGGKKQKKVEQTEADAEFLKKLGNWWNTKGQKYFETGKKIFNAYKGLTGKSE